MAQGGETFPQQFALGILNLYTTLQNRKAQLQEMRADRAARNLLEEQRLQLDQGNQAFQQEMQKAQFNALLAERDAETKYRYDVLRENRKAAAQDAVTKFAAGQATFFPMGTPLPKAPTVKNEKGEEVPQFEYDSYEMPGLGTYVLPRNKLSDELGLQQLAETRQKDRIAEIRQWMEAEHDRAQSELFEAQARELDAQPHDPKRVQLAQALHLKMLSQAENFITNWSLTATDAEKKKYGLDVDRAFADHIGKDAMDAWNDAKKVINSYYSPTGGGAQPPAGGVPPTAPSEIKQWLHGLIQSQKFQLQLGPLLPAPATAAPIPDAAAPVSNTLAGSALPPGWVALEEPVDAGAWPGEKIPDSALKGGNRQTRMATYRQRNFYAPDNRGLQSSQLLKDGKIIATKGDVPGGPQTGLLPIVPRSSSFNAQIGGFSGSTQNLYTPIHLNDLTPEENQRVNEIMLKATAAPLSSEEYRELDELSRKRSFR